MRPAKPHLKAAVLSEVESRPGLPRETLIMKTAQLLEDSLTELVAEGRLIIEPSSTNESHMDVFRATSN